MGYIKQERLESRFLILKSSGFRSFGFLKFEHFKTKHFYQGSFWTRFRSKKGELVLKRELFQNIEVIDKTTLEI